MKWHIWRDLANEWRVTCGNNPFQKCECTEFPTWREAWDYAIAKATEVRP